MSKNKTIIDGIEVTGKPSHQLRLIIHFEVDLTDALYSGLEEVLENLQEIGSAELKSAEFIQED